MHVQSINAEKDIESIFIDFPKCSNCCVKQVYEQRDKFHFGRLEFSFRFGDEMIDNETNISHENTREKVDNLILDREFGVSIN